MYGGNPNEPTRKFLHPDQSSVTKEEVETLGKGEVENNSPHMARIETRFPDGTTTVEYVGIIPISPESWDILFPFDNAD